MRGLRRVPAGWKHAPQYAGGKAFVWQNAPEGSQHIWVAFPGPKGGWLIKDKAPGAESPMHAFVSLESFEDYVRSTPNP